MPIEMVRNDLKFHLAHRCRCEDEASTKMNDLTYCNKKFDHIYRVVDRVIAFSGGASGL